MSDSGEVLSDPRFGTVPRGADARRPQAASVSNRWWEANGTGHPGAGEPASAPGTPLWQSPPPAPPALETQAPALPPATSSGGGELAMVERRQLELELEAARAEVAALHEMLEDLPEIFERKFRQRVQGLIAEQQRLLADNQMLRDRLYALTPATPTALPAARAATGPVLPSLGSFASLREQRTRLRRSLREALGSLRGFTRSEASSDARLSESDDGRTTAA